MQNIIPATDCGTLQESLADKTILLIAQVAPENKEILCYYWERSKDISLLSNHCLLFNGYNTALYEIGQINIRDSTNS